MEAQAELWRQKQKWFWRSVQTQVGAQAGRILEVWIQGEAERVRNQADGSATGRQKAGGQTALGEQHLHRSEDEWNQAPGSAPVLLIRCAEALQECLLFNTDAVRERHSKA